MLFSYEWIADLVEVERGIDAAREVSERLTGAGLAVEMIEERDGDVVLDIDVTTNRPDCMNHYGLAREVAVLTGAQMRPDAEPVERTGAPATDAVRVVIEDPDGCRRFTASVIRGVTIGPSPDWLVRRLVAIGSRPINNVVDVTNYVMWEMGQPLHAFDLAKIPVVDGAGGPRAELRIRQAAEGETLTTLDGESRELAPGMLVVADAEKPVAVAGVMGGLDSEVTDATTDILLEVAHFDPKTVRRTAGALAMHTDASHRFERGADPEAPLVAAARAAALLAELAGSTTAPGAVDERGSWPDEWPPRGRLELARLVRFAGVDLAADDVERWFAGLGFRLEPEDGDADGPVWQVTVPSWRYYDFAPGRPDGAGVWEADLFEEALRLHGLDAIPAALPDLGGADGPRTPVQRRRDRIHEHLVACGFAESINFAFLSREADRELPALAQLLAAGEGASSAGEALALANPISERYGVLRRSLLPNLIANAGFNHRRGAESVRLFEIGHVFFDRPPAASENVSGLPLTEFETVALVAGGAAGSPWDQQPAPDLFAFKGVVEALGNLLGTALGSRPAVLPGLVEGSTAELTAADGRVVGFFGLVDPSAAEGPGDGFDLFAAELLCDRLGIGAGFDAEGGGSEVEVPSRFPAVAADLTLTHAAEVAWSEIAAAVEAVRPEHLTGFALKDRYDGEGVPDGAVNTTLHFSYGSSERSLTHDEVNDSQQALAARLQELFGWADS